MPNTLDRWMRNRENPMSLEVETRRQLDDFAGRAMQGLVQADPDFASSPSGVARVANQAYAVARAMLLERARGAEAGT